MVKALLFYNFLIRCLRSPYVIQEEFSIVVLEDNSKMPPRFTGE